VRFAAYEDPSSATWALPLALERLKLDPVDQDSLTEFVTLAVLANQRDKIAEAEALAKTANAQAADSIAAAIAAGIKQAATSGSATSSPGQR